MGERFKAAAAQIKLAGVEKAGTIKDMTNDQKLGLYGLYKQTTEGDNTTEKPGMFSFEAKAKWENWEKQKGVPKEQAAEEYIALANQLLTKYGAEKYKV